MCMITSHVPIITDDPYKPTYVLKFGWIINGLNIIYFRQQGSHLVFYNLETNELSLCAYEERIFRVYL